MASRLTDCSHVRATSIPRYIRAGSPLNRLKRELSTETCTKEIIQRTCVELIPSWRSYFPEAVEVTQMLGGCSRVLYRASIKSAIPQDVLYRVQESHDRHEQDIIDIMCRAGLTSPLLHIGNGFRLEAFINGKHPE
eukprot:UN24907